MLLCQLAFALALRRWHCAPRGGGVKDLTAAARSALAGRSLTPSPDPRRAHESAEARWEKESSRRVDRFDESGVRAGALL